MYYILMFFIVIFTGWTLAAHITTAFNGNLHHLIKVAPFFIFIVGLIAYFLKNDDGSVENYNSVEKTYSNVKANSVNKNVVCTVSLFPIVALYFSWNIFWVLAVFLLIFGLVYSKYDQLIPSFSPRIRKYHYVIIFFLIVIAVLFTLTVSRSDMDDAFYVSVASFVATFPGHALLSVDPMHGAENLPLIIPSYRFASYELLAGTLGFLFNIPTMNFIYIYMPAVSAILVVVTIFLLAQVILPRRWFLLGIITIAFTIYFGESHQGQANFMFVRLFQGKAIYVSIIIPAIYYYIGKYLSQEKSLDLFLFMCSQIVAIGLTNFGMLAAVLASTSAILSNFPLIDGSSNKFKLKILAASSIPLPYLIYVALQTGFGQHFISYPITSEKLVWEHVFGLEQQYLIAMLMLVGPLLVQDKLTKWRLTIPVLVLLGVLLNPLLSDFISQHVTTPPVYWRVTWSLPILMFCASSICILLDSFEKRKVTTGPIVIVCLLCVLTFQCRGLHTFRTKNIDHLEMKVGWKISAYHLLLCKEVINFHSPTYGTIAAPDEISGVLSRFEGHPPLVSVRLHYLKLLEKYFSEGEFDDRSVLRAFIYKFDRNKITQIHNAIVSLNVTTIVFEKKLKEDSRRSFLLNEGFRQNAIIGDYVVWRRILD